MSEQSYTGKSQLKTMALAANYNRSIERLIEAGIAGARTVLDFGAGQGQFALALRARIPGIVAVEPDPDLRRLLLDAGIKCYETVAAVPDESLDAAYSINVLEHIDADLDAMREIARCLRPGGVCVVYVPAFPCLFSSMDAEVGHVRRYRRAELVAMLTKAGFTVRHARYADFLGFFATIAFKCLGNRSGEVAAGPLRTYDRLVFPISAALDRLRLPLGKNLVVTARKL